jgi:hypothetical protein
MSTHTGPARRSASEERRWVDMSIAKRLKDYLEEEGAWYEVIERLVVPRVVEFGSRLVGR